MKWMNRLALVLFLLGGLLTPASAGFVVVEDFNSPSPPDGRVLYDADPAYDAIPGPLTGGSGLGNPVSLNGFIVTSAAGIATGQGGSGFFLFNNTGDGDIHAGEVWGTITPLAVVPGSLYEFSFYLTNQNTIQNAIIQPTINGLPVGAAVSALGTFSTDGWQQFAVTWDSGAATTADLSLVNLRAAALGNDFGIDTITFGPAGVIPEPSSLTLLALGGLAAGALGLRRRGRKGSQ